MARKIERPTPGPPAPVSSVEQQTPSSSPRRPPVTNVTLLGQQLAQAFGAAQALIDRIPKDRDVTIEELRRWYYRQHPVERDRVLWQRFTEAEHTYARLASATGVAREAHDGERAALKQAEAERKLLAAQRLPATVEEEATDRRPDAVRGYQLTGVECQKRQAAIAELERLLPSPEQTLRLVTEVVVLVLEAVVTIDREALVRRVRESGELEQLRTRFERLRAMANTHETELKDWTERAGRQLRVPWVTFPWPPVSVWTALLDAPAQGPELLRHDQRGAPTA
jgi:hypothetical protein